MSSGSLQDACSPGTLEGLPHLKMEQLWKTARSGFDTDVTLVTQLSLDRLVLCCCTC